MMRFLRLVVMGAILGTCSSVFLKYYQTNVGSCSTFYRQDTIVTGNGNYINAEVAKTEAAREKGLGGRKCIGPHQGMLFVFDRPGYYPFWMKNMKFPIDIIWIDADHKVVTVKPLVPPSSYPSNFNSYAPAQFVLEIQAGEAKSYSITPGAKLDFNL